MNNEPVAWRRVIGNVTKHYEYNEFGVGEPLYSLETVRLLKLEIEHQKERELTDEEIEEFEWLIKKQFNFPTGEKVVGLDRIIKAILRKAQE